MHTIKNLIFLLTPHERKRALVLLIMILIMALLDMIGVASILPFIAVLTNPTLIETNLFLNSLYQALFIFGVETNQHFIFALGILLFLLLVISLSFKALTIYFQVKFIEMCEYNISKRLVEGYLNQPYSWFITQHSADLGTKVLSEAGQISGGGIKPLIEIIAKGAITLALIVLLIFVDPKLTLIIGLMLSGSYLIIFYIIRKQLSKIGKERLKNNQLRYKIVSEAFGATKEVKVGSLEKIYTDLFTNSAKIFAQSNSFAQVIAQLPRYFLETIAFGGVLILMLYMMSQSGSFNEALPIISLYVFAGYRLMPALQQVYASFNNLTFNRPSIDRLTEDFKKLGEQKIFPNKETLIFKNEISLSNICYNYPSTSRKALKDISLNIKAKTTVAIVGPTGSGKTTLVDIILGLLVSQKGNLKVDGEIIEEKNVRSWQSCIGYVPQHIFLSDDTIAANIAFGKKSNEINQLAVERAAKIANLHHFVMSELPNKYETKIGERGVRLSGGQRQRVGIARALYNDPQVIILDEATSALDNQTEKAVMDAVNNLNKESTIILIAHRLSTVKKCDQIFLIESGELKGQGKFNELVIADENFRKSANS